MSDAELGETITRNCSVCGTELTIEIFDDSTYDGGHYFDIPFDEHDELWECDDCYV